MPSHGGSRSGSGLSAQPGEQLFRLVGQDCAAGSGSQAVPRVRPVHRWGIPQLCQGIYGLRGRDLATDKQYLLAGANFGGASGAGSCGGAGGYGGGGGGVGGSSSPPPYGAGGSGSATPGGGGNTPRGGAQSGAQRGGQGQGKGTPPAPRATQAAQQKQVKNQQQQQKAANISYGVHAPCSKTIVGETIGLDGPGPNFTCWGCNTAGGHFKGECPTLWGQRGKPLPGFNKDGDREPGAWNGDEPKRATFKKWVSFLEDSDNFAAGVVPANFPGAPELDAFKDRAASARK